MISVGLDWSFLDRRLTFFKSLPTDLSAAAVLLGDDGPHCSVYSTKYRSQPNIRDLPMVALKLCLERARVSIDDVDSFVVCGNEDSIDRFSEKLILLDPSAPRGSARQWIQGALESAFSVDLSSRIFFHDSRVASARGLSLASGYGETLCLFLDTRTEGLASEGYIAHCGGGAIHVLNEFGAHSPMATLYRITMDTIGLSSGDEYELERMAEVGDPAAYREMFNGFCQLLPKGAFGAAPEVQILSTFNTSGLLRSCLDSKMGMKARCDIASAYMALEKQLIVHVLTEYRRTTNARGVCFGGRSTRRAALAAAAVGELGFSKVFVQGRSDSETRALGAAAQASVASGSAPALGLNANHADESADGFEALRCVDRWGAVVEVERHCEIATAIASRVSSGDIVALIDASDLSRAFPLDLYLVSSVGSGITMERKSRLEAICRNISSLCFSAKDVSSLFRLPVGGEDITGGLIDLRPSAALEHCPSWMFNKDGTVTVTVTSETSPNRLLGDVIDIVSTRCLMLCKLAHSVSAGSIDEAIELLLTTEIDCLAVGSRLISKRASLGREALLSGLIPRLAPGTSLSIQVLSDQGKAYAIEASIDGRASKRISKSLFGILSCAQVTASLGERCRTAGVEGADGTTDLLETVWQLWCRRYIQLSPGALA